MNSYNSGIPQRKDQVNDAIPKIAPKWLKYDRQQLVFDAFFIEPVVEDPNENFRARKCKINYFLDDDTIYVYEPKIENSGIPQGIFLKRHKLPFPEDQSKYYTWRDLNIGMNFNVYQRVFRIVDCDDFTRRFYSNEGNALNNSEGYPEDLFKHTRAMINFKQTPPDQAEMKNYIEVQLKGGRPNKALESFLDNDRKVLAFNILWEDRSFDGGDKHFVLNYYLSDQSVDIKEINVQNSGQYPFPKLLKKEKLSKSPIMTHCPGMSLKDDEFYTPVDLMCGTRINVWGRVCLIYDCDKFTKDWYTDNLGITQKATKLAVPRPNVTYQAIPAYNGYGTPEDSLGSVYALNPKPPKQDMKKMFKQDMHILRFEASLISTEPDDESRIFIISFYCGDDTVQVYELCDKNSGRIGGAFMERQKQTNPVNGKYYQERDFLIGKMMFLAGFKFRLVKSDEYTEKYMEDNANVFPEASIDALIQKMKKASASYPSLQEYAVHMVKVLDKNQDGFVTMDEFCFGLKSMNIFLSNHEEHTLLRRFDTNGDNKISMEEFYNCIAASF